MRGADKWISATLGESQATCSTGCLYLRVVAIFPSYFLYFFPKYQNLNSENPVGATRTERMTWKASAFILNHFLLQRNTLTAFWMYLCATVSILFSLLHQLFYLFFHTSLLISYEKNKQKTVFCGFLGVYSDVKSQTKQIIITTAWLFILEFMCC